MNIAHQQYRAPTWMTSPDCRVELGRRRVAPSNGRRIIAVIAMVSGVFFGGGGPSSAMDSCSQLRFHDNVWIGVSLASQKPQNVTVTEDGKASVTVSWDIHDDFPTDVLTGFCVKKTHAEHNFEAEMCPPRPTETSTLITSCFGRTTENLPDCLMGTVNFRVKLTTNCGLQHPYSDAVSYDFQW